jgi:hypothetical protein
MEEENNNKRAAAAVLTWLSAYEYFSSGVPCRHDAIIIIIIYRHISLHVISMQTCYNNVQLW